MNNSITTIEPRGIKVDIYRLYGTILIDIQAYISSTILLSTRVAFPKFKEYTKLPFIVKVSALLKPAI